MDIALLSQDVSTHIALIKDKQISAQELATEQHSFIKRVNSSINAFISYAMPNVEQSASFDKSLFQGICIGVKDNIDVRGFATTAGMATRVGRQAKQDAFVVSRLKQTGVQVMGKLNMHEGALGATNQNEHFGDCHNPHKHGYTPGGSSGGSAAAVASGMVGLSLGTDTMGSVRIPAAYCGIFGFKPSRGAVSNHGTVTCSRVMDNIGPLARSAKDLTLALSVMKAFDEGCAASIDFSAFNRLSYTDNKVLLVPENLEQLGVAPDIAADFATNLTAFTDLGFSIQYFDFSGYDFGAARRAGLLLCEADMRIEHQEDWANNQHKFSGYMRGMLSYIERKSPMDMMQSERVLDNAKVFARQLFKQGCAILMPTVLQRAFAFEEPVPANQADLTSFANQAGLPAVSLPMFSDNPLPAGMQIVGPLGSDNQLLQLAERWQEHTQFRCILPSVD
ncbi:aspartyl/glutamyl-tRNA(Asn/Gln) amidotransferase subunit A [Paraglaciecola sp. T6c]|uniref:amidase n=1 Tax=Pseudoalteromonas atlantica (strain T6c / ATCC BAA-1087) TaxID=3042615 RepID=UPI00005C736A|nr:amidase [Paraglaciecola sp. T6c]ABG40035.1 aspartyl/glutamyl-tRNA(Asn/Gln) amidotransferase subunit A [Paraglaciecola sp. T6c]